MGLNQNQSNNIPLFVALFFATISCSSAYNITYFLDDHPDFSTYNSILTKTGLDKIINRLNSTITVLAVDNSGMGSLSGQSQSSQKAILATHVLFDYFDADKLEGMEIPRTVTNLYQRTGKSSGKRGSTSITRKGKDFIFYSAAKGAPKSSKFVTEVGSKPFDIIVLQINTPIVVPGLNSTPIAYPPEEPPSPSPSPAPTPDNDVADGPEADSPGASSPAPSPNLSPEDAPVGDADQLDKKDGKSGGATIMANVGGLVAGVILALLL